MKTNKSLSQIISSIACITLLSCFPHCRSKCTSPKLNPSPGGFDGIFAFGNSVCEAGNNNFLIGCKSNANYPPYGIDYASGPSGRFTNGKTFADLIVERLGLPPAPPFLDPKTKGKAIINGVSYASGGSGILDETGSKLGGVITLNRQIDNFANVTLPELETLVGCKQEELLSRYLFVLASGNNDYQLTYLLGPKTITLEAFTNKVIAQVSSQLTRLYNAGARNFVVVSTNPVGCNPWLIEFTKSNGCNKDINEACKQFYTRLVSLAGELKVALHGSEILVVSNYNIILDIINDPLPRGFENARSPCCELKAINNLKLVCKEGGGVCSNRNKTVYFDGQHTTQAVNEIIAAAAFASSNASQVYPFSIRQLLDLHRRI